MAKTAIQETIDRRPHYRELGKKVYAVFEWGFDNGHIFLEEEIFDLLQRLWKAGSPVVGLADNDNPTLIERRLAK